MFFILFFFFGEREADQGVISELFGVIFHHWLEGIVGHDACVGYGNDDPLSRFPFFGGLTGVNFGLFSISVLP